MENETFRWMCEDHTFNEIHQKCLDLRRRHGNANLEIDGHKFGDSYIEWKVCR